MTGRSNIWEILFLVLFCYYQYLRRRSRARGLLLSFWCERTTACSGVKECHCCQSCFACSGVNEQLLVLVSKNSCLFWCQRMSLMSTNNSCPGVKEQLLVLVSKNSCLFWCQRTAACSGVKEQLLVLVSKNVTSVRSHVLSRLVRVTH